MGCIDVCPEKRRGDSGVKQGDSSGSNDLKMWGLWSGF